MLPTQPREVIICNMRNVSWLTLGILTSMYLKAEIGAVGEGFAATCSEDEAYNLVQSFLETVTRMIEMIPIDMS
jgi:hypothetical protein